MLIFTLGIKMYFTEYIKRQHNDNSSFPKSLAEKRQLNQRFPKLIDFMCILRAHTPPPPGHMVACSASPVDWKTVPSDFYSQGLFGENTEEQFPDCQSTLPNEYCLASHKPVTISNFKSHKYPMG